MYCVVEGRMRGEFVISTARNGLGSAKDSYRTPTGLHRVVEKIGDGVPLRGVFQERRYTGDVAGPGSDDGDVITSRILRLGGLEPGVNQGGTVDSQERAIYIHGTADEASLGRPSSHGCIRMYNADVVRLFDQVPLGTLVVILDN
ncbi:MAG: L,D-transpeptidase [Bacteroidetes bacterium]|nr:L,D-transpeptidase [Bacteroidota bacterium]